MTAIRPRDVASMLKRRDERFAAVLLYGNDAGTVRERSDILARQIVADLTDPFNFIELTDTDLKEEPGRLPDEAAALSFAGGERVIRIRATGGASMAPVEAAAKLLVAALDNGSLKPNAVTLIEAGALKKTSPLRKAFEKSDNTAAIGCYEDTQLDLKDMIEEMLRAENMTITDDALMLLTAALGTDRGISRAEMEKLILFCGPASMRATQEPYRVTPTDVAECLADFTQDMAGDIAALAADGKSGELSAALWRAAEAGASPVTILVFLQRHFARLYAAQSLVHGGEAPQAAMKKLKPPVFYNEERSFAAQLRRWPLARLEAALQNLLEAEHKAKTTGMPQTEIIERTALRLAAMAGRG